MAGSSVLSRLPINGTVIDSRGAIDAFKIPLLNEDGKLNVSLLADDSTIYDVAGISYSGINFDIPSVTPNAPPSGITLFVDASEVFRYVDRDGNIRNLISARTENADWAAPQWSSAAIRNKPTLGTAAATDSSAYATKDQGLKADSASQPGHTHTSTDVTDLSALLSLKAPLDSPTFTGIVSGITKAMVGLESADNTSDLSKPISTAAQTALNLKSDVGHFHAVSEITNFDANVTNVVKTVKYATTIPGTTYSVKVGGADPEAASVWKTRTLLEALDTILFPTIPATISEPQSVSVSWGTGSTLTGATVEVGTTHTLVFSAFFKKGTILNGDGSTGPDLVGNQSGLVKVEGVGISLQSITAAAQQFSGIKILENENIWSLTVDYQPGLGNYYDNKAQLGSNIDRSAGSVTGTISTTGLYPYYYLKSPVVFTGQQFKEAIASGAASAIHATATLVKVVSVSTATLVIPYAPANQYIGVAYPASSAEKKSYYVASLDNGPITAVFSPVETLSTSGTAGTWSGKNYNYHISLTALTSAANVIELRNI
jgi:hypothetical protein